MLYFVSVFYVLIIPVFLFAVSELTRIQKELVRRVSAENITQLLEALVADSVLNELEKESILEKSPVRAKKARDLFNTVIQKGDQACSKTIHHLRLLGRISVCFFNSHWGLNFGKGKN
uniref:CARD domain-containing protein n=1 Tax=Xiphophorus couchianus TaxID=32473 RepID=A0A3B5MH98_9TELE